MRNTSAIERLEDPKHMSRRRDKNIAWITLEVGPVEPRDQDLWQWAWASRPCGESVKLELTSPFWLKMKNACRNYRACIWLSVEDIPKSSRYVDVESKRISDGSMKGNNGVTKRLS